MSTTTDPCAGPWPETLGCERLEEEWPPTPDPTPPTPPDYGMPIPPTTTSTTTTSTTTTLPSTTTTTELAVEPVITTTTTVAESTTTYVIGTPPEPIVLPATGLDATFGWLGVALILAGITVRGATRRK